MKIVCLSDTHTQHHMIKVPDGDILVFAGDFAGPRDINMSQKYTRDFAKWLDVLPHKHKIIIAGNHDTAIEKDPTLAVKYFSHMNYLHNSSVTVEGLKFWGSPYTPEFCDWAFNLDRKGTALEDCWAQIPDDTDVLITHGPPRGYLDEGGSEAHCGCSKLLDAVLKVKPQLHIFGHIHEGAGRKAFFDGTTFINASIVDTYNQPYSEPVVINIGEDND